MMKEGPLLELLLRRVAECPPDFIPGRAEQTINAAAVVSDLLVDLGGAMLPEAEARQFVKMRSSNAVELVLIGCWLLHDDYFCRTGGFAENAKRFLLSGINELAPIKAGLFITDGERREELVRLTLKALGLRPKGEKENEARDRLTEISSVEAARVAKELKEAEARAKKLREAMAKKAAQEAAAKVSRE